MSRSTSVRRGTEATLARTNCARCGPLEAPVIAGRSGGLRSLRAALAFGGGFQLAARSVDVAAPGRPHRRRNTRLKDDVAEGLDPLVGRAFVRCARPRIEGDQIDLRRQLILANQANQFTRMRV